MSKFDEAISQLASRWSKLGIANDVGARDDELSDVARALGAGLPDAFATYLRRLNGMKDMDMDSELFSLWSLQRIRTEALESGRETTVLAFADWSLECHRYAISLRAADFGVIYIEHSELESCSDSFESFIVTFAANSTALLPRPMVPRDGRQ